MQNPLSNFMVYKILKICYNLKIKSGDSLTETNPKKANSKVY